MIFTLNIETNNHAVVGRERFATADYLRTIAKKLVEGQTDGTVKDENGNTIGKYSIEI